MSYNLVVSSNITSSKFSVILFPHFRMLQFFVKIGSSLPKSRCFPASSQNESVIIQYSSDNSISWHTLKLLDPTVMEEGTLEVTLELLPDAKGPYVMFRWWQPLITAGKPPRGQTSDLFIPVFLCEFVVFSILDLVVTTATSDVPWRVPLRI